MLGHVQGGARGTASTPQGGGQRANSAAPASAAAAAAKQQREEEARRVEAEEARLKEERERQERERKAQQEREEEARRVQAESNSETIHHQEEKPDEALKEAMLAAVHPKLLSRLREHFRFVVRRRNITRNDPSLQGLDSDGTGALDEAEGVCMVGGGRGVKDIIVRSVVQDANVLVDFGVLLHEIGHGFDYKLACFQHTGASQPFHKSSTSTRGAELDMEQAYIDEHRRFQRPYFHQQPEFFAEVFARYALDRTRTKKQFPKSVAVLDTILRQLGILSNPESESLVDAGRLSGVLERMMPPPPVTTEPDCWNMVRERESVNSSVEDEGRDRTVYALGLITEDETAARVIARDASRRLFNHREHGNSAYSIDDAYREVDMSSGTLDSDLFRHCYGHHALVLLAKAKGVTQTSPGLQAFISFASRTFDLSVPFFYGNRDELEAVEAAFRNGGIRVKWMQCQVHDFTPQQVQTQLLRRAYVEGKFFSEESKALLLETITRLRLSFLEVEKIWRALEECQSNRVDPLIISKSISQKGYFNILTLDVEPAMKRFKRNLETDPLEDLNAMIGLEEVKSKVTAIINQLKGNIRKKNRGLSPTLPKLYILFLGNPGTGKTVISNILRRVLQQIGFVATKRYIEIGAKDIRNEADMQRIFTDNKDGIIFIDEIHQLASSEEKKQALKLMVPYLTNPDFARTVVIGAGYKRQTLKMLTDESIDPGLDSRFDVGLRFEFKDYTRDQVMRPMLQSSLRGLRGCCSLFFSFLLFSSLLFSSLLFSLSVLLLFTLFRVISYFPMARSEQFSGRCALPTTRRWRCPRRCFLLPFSRSCRDKEQ